MREISAHRSLARWINGPASATTGITLVVPKRILQHGSTLTLCQFNEVNAHDIDGFLARDLIA
ncbi:MAG: hypothetical protein R3A10_22005 [Caldilineaceae bacterium]